MFLCSRGWASTPVSDHPSHAISVSAMSSSQVGYLVPLNHNLEEDTTVAKLSVSNGTNVIGRDSISVKDKRLSRRHLSLTVSGGGSATLVVEGTNPVVVNSGGERKKLSSQDQGTIHNGDIVELIPGHYFFKYDILSGERNGSSVHTTNNKRTSSDGRGGTEEEGRSSKRSKQGSKNRACVSSSEVELHLDGRKQQNSVGKQDSNAKRECNSEAIRHFHVPNEKVPLTFRLLHVQGLPSWANTSSVSIGDVIEGDVLVAVLSNYMVDVDWLLAACPTLVEIPHVLVIHGESDGRVELMKKSKPANWILHKPPLPISFGTHHSKAMFLVYPRGVRIIVHTANLIYVDWNNKTQGLWMQDFPWKDKNNTSEGSGFENDLIDYLSMLKIVFFSGNTCIDFLQPDVWPEFSINLPSIGSFKINSSFFRKFDYSGAKVRLIASVPGYHSGSNLKRWGHMKLRSVLQECTFENEFNKAPLVYQFSSLGSLDEKWMTELASSMSAGLSKDKTPLGIGQPCIIWPTVEDVRCSLEGYAAGNAIPSPLKNVEKEFLKKYWAKWKASHTGRCRAMPHIKTFTRYNGQKLAWFLLTSANLSKAAWGALQKKSSQLMIRSYELGVLFLPTSVKTGACTFSCTSKPNLSEGKGAGQRNSEIQRTILSTLTYQTTEDAAVSSQYIQLPVPYELPPLPYTSEDIPWSWDRRYNKKDVYGQVWPRQVQLYISDDS